MCYDTRCYDLATAFLADSPDLNTEANRNYLAQHIQDEIDGTIKYILPDIKPVTNGADDKSIAKSGKG